MLNFTSIGIDKRSLLRKRMSVSSGMMVIFLSALGMLLTARAIAQEHADCFMRDKSGNLLNLTQSVCRLFPEDETLSSGPGAAGAYIIPIKGRSANLPIVDVTFNGDKNYDMILDTGASGTLITQEMAAALELEITEQAKSLVADGREVDIGIGIVDSISAGGLTISQVRVGIAPPSMPIGLLGQDFFGTYDMTIKEEVVELRARGG